MTPIGAPQQAATARPSEALVAALVRAAAVLAEGGRDDLAARVRVAAARVARPQTVVCVVGEFKQGKSMLVNALLGRPVCPVDDDLATSVVTVVQHAPATSVAVLRREDGQRVREAISPADLPRYVTEAGNPGNALGVEQVAIGVDDPFLAAGYALVDTPGVGGLGAGHAAATLAFLPYADAVVLVSDASAELSAPEVEFLVRAIELGPQVVHVLSKTDLHADWRTIAERNCAHLAAVAPGVALVAVSARAAIAAIERDDVGLRIDSGIGELVDHLDATALDAARRGAADRAVTEALDALAVVRASSVDERALLDDPEGGQRRRAELDAAVARLEHLRGPGARWSQRLADATGELSARATHRFRAAMRELGRSMDERIEGIDSPQAWDELGRQLQTDVATVVGDLFGFVEQEVAAARLELVELLALDALAPAGSRAELAVEEVLAVRLRELTEEGRIRKAAGGSIGVLRGAQSGLMMMGLLGRFVPAGAAALLFSNPVTLVLGAAFAGKAAFDIRKRNLANRRVQARAAVRQFLDDVQFEVGNELAEALRSRQRDLREQIAAAVAETTLTVTGLAERARVDLQAGVAAQAERRRALEALDAALVDAERALRAAATDAVAGGGSAP